MFGIYRMLTIVINSFLFIGVLVTIYEIIIGGYSDTEESLLFSMICLYIILSTSYFVWKTRNVSKKRINDNTIDDDDIEIFKLDHFRFAKITGISNLTIGVLILGMAVYILIFFPIRFVLIEELLRLFILVFSIFYGGLKMYYSIFILKRINLQSNIN